MASACFNSVTAPVSRVAPRLYNTKALARCSRVHASRLPGRRVECAVDFGRDQRRLELADGRQHDLVAHRKKIRQPARRNRCPRPESRCRPSIRRTLIRMILPLEFDAAFQHVPHTEVGGDGADVEQSDSKHAGLPGSDEQARYPRHRGRCFLGQTVGQSAVDTARGPRSMNGMTASETAASMRGGRVADGGAATLLAGG